MPSAPGLVQSRDLASGRGRDPGQGVALGRWEAWPGQGPSAPPVPLGSAPSSSWTPNPAGWLQGGLPGPGAEWFRAAGSALRDLSPRPPTGLAACALPLRPHAGPGRAAGGDGGGPEVPLRLGDGLLPHHALQPPAQVGGSLRLRRGDPLCPRQPGTPPPARAFRAGPSWPKDLDLPLPQVLASAGQRAAGGGLRPARAGAPAGQLLAVHGPQNVPLPAVPAGLQQPRGQRVRGRGEDPVPSGRPPPSPSPPPPPFPPSSPSSPCPSSLPPHTPSLSPKKVFIVPVGNHSNIPFSRMSHSKFMVTEKAAYIGEPGAGLWAGPGLGPQTLV